MAQIDSDKLGAYLNKQLAACQVAWMDAVTNKKASEALQYARVMDVLYDAANKFVGMPIPAPGQGYQPPGDMYDKLVKQRTLDEIDAQISQLERLREEVKHS